MFCCGSSSAMARKQGLGMMAALGALVALSSFGLENSHVKWEQEIAEFEAVDRTNAPPANPIVFIGSSSIRLWKTLASDFSDWPVINRGFGGSEMADSVYFADRIIVPY